MVLAFRITFTSLFVLGSLLGGYEAYVCSEEVKKIDESKDSAIVKLTAQNDSLKKQLINQ